MIDDYRWYAADTVLKKSMTALQALQSAREQTLARTPAHGLMEPAPEPADDALLIETERAMRMSSAALETFTDADGKAN